MHRCKKHRSHAVLWIVAIVVAVVASMIACGAATDSRRFDDDDDDGTTTGTGGDIGFDAGAGGNTFVGDPKTCEQAAQAKTYIGCDFWPTVTANNVWSIFDFAVVVANTGDNVVDATVTQGPNVVATAQIAPNSLQTIYLPWVPQLKGPDADECGSATPLAATVRVPNGAYHLTTTFPVTVYQFNALEYAGQGGPPGKSWANCPGDFCYMGSIGCFSFSNDASLLLPSTALTPHYRVTGTQGWSIPALPSGGIGAYIAVTGVHDGTEVDVFLSSTGSVVAGGGVNAAGPGGTVHFSLAAGEVVELVAPPTADLSGSLVKATQPVQVIAGMPCVNVPTEASACDHVEESVFPAETLGAHYFVTRPAGPNGNTPGHVVRIYGNVDGTQLSYPAGQPPGAPPSINAGQVVDLGHVTMDFEIEGTHEFAVGSLLPGASIVDPGAVGQEKGDPAQSLATAVEQYRDKYVFLAPTDYDVNYVDIIQPMSASVSVDGAPVGVAPVAIGGSGYGVARVPLGPGAAGAHVLESSSAVGIQVEGYGAYTSYYYPGGLNLTAIAPPPLK